MCSKELLLNLNELLSAYFYPTNIWKLTITYPGHSEIQTQNLSDLLWRNGKLFNFAKTILLFAYKFDL